MNYQQLNPYEISLSNNALIEASAGTGKTYNIALLYIRLILGLDDLQAALPISQILVVTFTKAATEELRDRIRKRLLQMHSLLNAPNTDHDPALIKILSMIDERKIAHDLCIDLLKNAITQIDQASIFTIHSFCQHVLNQHAFLAKIPFDLTLSTDMRKLIDEAAIQFWRQECYFFEPHLAQWAHKIYISPQKLVDELGTYLQKPYLSHHTKTQDNIKSLSELSESYLKKSKDCKKFWNDHKNSFINSLSPLLHKTYYKEAQFGQYASAMDVWANSDDIDLCLYCEKFTKTYFKKAITKTKPLPDPPEIFNQFEEMISALEMQPNEIKTRLKYFAVRMIDHHLTILKEKAQTIGFDDLLYFCHRVLSSDHGKFADALRLQYPVAMIDEFQDTDSLQYEIFSQIYPQFYPQTYPQDSPADHLSDHSPSNSHAHVSSLIMIGDPKQAIYSFRNADIHAYLEAKSKTSNIYTLNENYRATKTVCNAINQLFGNINNPFIEPDIPFSPISYPKEAQHKHLMLDDIPQAGLVFHAANNNQDLAQAIAFQIDDILEKGKTKRARLSESKPVVSQDIAILVRSGSDADLMRDALQQYGIESVYFSEKNTIFQQPCAHQFYLILAAIENPKALITLKQALATPLFGLSTTQLSNIIHSEILLETYIFQFIEFFKIWQNYGVLALTQTLLTHNYPHGCIKQNILKTKNGTRDLADILHLAELLQVKGRTLPATDNLLAWLYDEIENPVKAFDETTCLRMERESNAIQIFTYHKSKGLEFPIVFIPFAVHLAKSNGTKFDAYNDDLKKRVLNFDQSKTQQEQQDDEWLKEELRLLYVAVTRTSYQCHLGIYDVKVAKGKPLKAAALHYLLGCDAENSLSHCAQALAQQYPESILFHEVTENDVNNISTSIAYTHSNKHLPNLTAKVFKRKLDQTWHFTSYSSLSRGYKNTPESATNNVITALKYADKTSDLITSSLPKAHLTASQNLDLINSPDNNLSHNLNHNLNHNLDEIPNDDDLSSDNAKNANFLFPKGSHAGIFLHSLLERFDTKILLDETILLTRLTQSNMLDEPLEWLVPMTHWLNCIVHTPLIMTPQKSGTIPFSLSTLNVMQTVSEFEFIYPINQILNARKLDALIQKYYPNIQDTQPLFFENIHGMLKGFIDLVCEWNGKFYLIDYKSNYLGDNYAHYIESELYLDIKSHRYELQFLIYTVGLHRYLRTVKPDYNYEQDFGGVLYLYLRGLNGHNNKTGVYFNKPKAELIDTLDSLFG